jgi:hypothetical protein
LADRESALISGALDAGQGVFAILTPNEKTAMEPVLKQKHFQLVKRAAWTEPLNIPLNVFDDEDSPRGRRQSSDYFPRETVLVPPFDAGVGIIHWAPESLGVYQILRAP